MATTIDLGRYMTVREAAASTGIPPRTLYRIMERIGIDEVSATILGRRMILRAAVPRIVAEHAPVGSDRRHAMAVEHGRAGGAAKARNAKQSLRNCKTKKA